MEQGRFDLEALLLGKSTGLRFVVRYQTRIVNSNETVAEHSFYVVLYSYLIAQWVMNARGFMSTEYPPIDYEQLASKAVLHDIEEALTGDAPRGFKYSTPELLHAYQQAAIAATRSVVGDIFPGSSFLNNKMFTRWLCAKDESQEGCIVALADFLSCLSYLSQESQRGNTVVRTSHAGIMRDYFVKFREPPFTFLSEIVDQAEVLLCQLFPEDKVV